jgi:hypothetical protein
VGPSVVAVLECLWAWFSHLGSLKESFVGFIRHLVLDSDLRST